MIDTVDVLYRLFRKKPFIISIMSAKSSGTIVENTEVTSRVFSAAIACGLNKGGEVGRKIVLVCGGPLSFNLLCDGSCKYRT
jgi:hypothetical protein